jgi:5-(carboxyamino)imidazole ribonucleotide synthase
VATTTTVAGYEDLEKLTAFANAVDVVTFEFENIPVSSVQLLSRSVAVRPSAHVLEIAQDRIYEKQFFNDLGIGTAPWREILSADDLKKAVDELGRPSVLKTARMGYDGKGQIKITEGLDLDQAWKDLRTDKAVLEGFITFTGELSVIIARAPNGESRCFDPVWNVHTNHILDTSTVPAPISTEQNHRAIQIATQAAQALDLQGLLAVELFLDASGEILVNEMAPRPHNSGHWTIDACVTDQFEQFIRAVCDLPLGDPIRHSDAVMTNLIGDDVERWRDILNTPHAKLHLYGKAEARDGRKMGHVTKVKPRTA